MLHSRNWGALFTGTSQHTSHIFQAIQIKLKSQCIGLSCPSQTESAYHHLPSPPFYFLTNTHEPLRVTCAFLLCWHVFVFCVVLLVCCGWLHRYSQTMCSVMKASPFEQCTSRRNLEPLWKQAENPYGMFRGETKHTNTHTVHTHHQMAELLNILGRVKIQKCWSKINSFIHFECTY